jgi:hypothetical protein
MYPFTVASTSCRYLRTLFGNDAGHPVKFPDSGVFDGDETRCMEVINGV